MSQSLTPTHPDDLARVDALLQHLEQLEQQLQEVRDGLGHSHRLATLGTIATIIAHEYNNILTPMMSYAQLALANPGDQELMLKAVRKAFAGAEKATQISSSLLGFAREADEQHAAPLPRTIDETLHCLARDPAKDGIELTIDVPDVQVAMSPTNLQQVLLNLILNARKVLRKQGGGNLSITAKVKGTLVYIEVSDTGPGIPEAIMDRLFEPFVTHGVARQTSIEDSVSAADDQDDDQHSASSDQRGTGLGLCICRDLVHQAGGDITVDSTPGQGASFQIMLPKADDIFDHEE